MYKLLTVVAILGAATAHDVLLGKSAGRKIYDEHFRASPAIWRRTDKIIINATDGEVISGVVITDSRPDKNGEVTVVDGGEGRNNVTVELKSPTVFRGYDFRVEVYSEPESEYFNHKSNDSKTLDDVTPDVPIMIGADTDVNTSNDSVVLSTEGSAVTLYDAVPSEATKVDQVHVGGLQNNEVNIPVEIAKAFTNDDNSSTIDGSGARDLNLATIFSSDKDDTQRNARDTDDFSTTESSTAIIDTILSNDVKDQKDVVRIVMHLELDGETSTTEEPSTTETYTQKDNYNAPSAPKMMVPVPYNREYVDY